MATRFHIGAKELRGNIETYAKRFDLLEVAMHEAGDKRASPPTTMRKWRQAGPAALRLLRRRRPERGEAEGGRRARRGARGRRWPPSIPSRPAA